jgi:hypothetical protein
MRPGIDLVGSGVVEGNTAANLAMGLARVAARRARSLPPGDWLPSTPILPPPRHASAPTTSAWGESSSIHQRHAIAVPCTRLRPHINCHAAQEARGQCRPGRGRIEAVAQELSCQSSLHSGVGAGECECCRCLLGAMRRDALLTPHRSRRMSSSNSRTASLPHQAPRTLGMPPPRSRCSLDGQACRASVALRLSWDGMD